jgi:hypothetical protein
MRTNHTKSDATSTHIDGIPMSCTQRELAKNTYRWVSGFFDSLLELAQFGQTALKGLVRWVAQRRLKRVSE